MAPNRSTNTNDALVAIRNANAIYCEGLLRSEWLDEGLVCQAQCSRCNGCLVVDLTDSLGSAECLDCRRSWSELAHYASESALPLPPCAVPNLFDSIHA